MEKPHVSTMVWLAGLNDVPNISKPWDLFETMGWNISKFYRFWRKHGLNLDFFCNLWLYFFHLLAVNQAGLSVNHPHVISWADLHRKGPTKGSNNTDPIRSYQHLDDKTLANISHCNVLFPAETKAHVANFISRLALLRPVSVRIFEVCHVTSVCAGFMADPPSVRCGSVASLDTLRPRPFLLRGVSQASRDLGLENVAG